MSNFSRRAIAPMNLENRITAKERKMPVNFGWLGHHKATLININNGCATKAKKYIIEKQA
ncbi:hypothetical protein C7B69_08205 [filamentous cyanobacterium Phorm 46]|nr:hypothetical protein C7B69_08205 [filamentous cyanobacterium Phorm 46]PSB51253.1 hypothetical protein C7B67_11540 [filamentous cyanobacterium Phorm 6]